MTQTQQNLISLAYKQNAVAAAQRLSILWDRQAEDRICAHMNVSTHTLRRFAETHYDGQTEYPDPYDRIYFWNSHLHETRLLEDDWLPIAYLSEFDQGIVGGAMGEEMRFMMHKDIGWISSMCAPVMNDLADCDHLRIDPTVAAIKLMDEQVRIFSDGARGKFGVAPFIIIDCMNFVAEMRGMTQAFEDTIDNPETVVSMMDFALEFNIFLQERVRRMTDGFMNGSFVNMGSWCQGNPILFSVDAYHMGSPDFYYQWGVPHLQRILDHFGGGLLHLHSNGWHLLPYVVKLRHLKCIYFADERWNPRAYDQLPKLCEQAAGTPLIISCQYDEFRRDLDSYKLPGNVLYDVQNVPSVDHGNRLMEKVRAYHL
ncbi:MAG: uroporphyrinogen decarboxylase/cobalamine-independent methonine synthase family protein [Armatimonadota bacterium]